MTRKLKRTSGYLLNPPDSIYRFRVTHPRYEAEKTGKINPDTLYHRAMLFYSRFNPQVAPQFRGKCILDARDNGNRVSFKWNRGREVRLNYLELYELKILLDEYWYATCSPLPTSFRIKKRKVK